MYAPQLGRFCGRDPIGYLAGGSNLYAYVAFRPLNHLDPFGLIVYGSNEIEHYVDIMRRHRMKIKFKIFVEDEGDKICVHVHARRYLEGNHKYRENWNRIMEWFEQWEGRGIWDPEHLWLFPNFPLLLNGDDDENPYGGPWGGYWDDNGNWVRRHPDDDYLELSISTSDSSGICDSATTNSWHAVGNIPIDQDPLTTVVHTAGSSKICVAKCPCGIEGSLSISLDYPDEKYGGNQGVFVGPYGPQDGDLGPVTINE